MGKAKLSIEEAKAKHEIRLLGLDGVEGVGIGEESAKPVIKVYVSKQTKALEASIPTKLEGYPVRIELSGKFRALASQRADK